MDTAKSEGCEFFLPKPINFRKTDTRFNGMSDDLRPQAATQQYLRH
jgi:hypothetical protein